MRNPRTIVRSAWIIVCVVILSGFRADAQDAARENDFASWLSVRMRKSFEADIDLYLEQQVRLPYSETLTEIAVKYQALGFLNLGGEMRFTFLKGGQIAYRPAGFAGLEMEKKDLTLEFRFKAQSDFNRFDDPEVTLRNKFEAVYEINKDWRVESGFELFLPKEDGYFALRELRWTAAVRYEFSKMHLLTVFYHIDRQKDVDIDDPNELTHVFGTRYDIRW